MSIDVSPVRRTPALDRLPTHFPLPPRQRGRFRLGGLVALLVLAAGLAGGWWIVSQPPRVERRPPPEPTPPLVDVITTAPAAHAPTLYGYGRVEAEQQTNLASRVAGQLERFAEGAVPGKVVDAGQPLAYIDSADLALALADAEAQVNQAEAQLELEQGEQQRARSEYQSFGRELTPERRSLVLREPQQREAEATVAQARAQRDQARLNLERATLDAPWRAMVQERLVGAGSLLSGGTEVIGLVGVEHFWVRASLPGEWLEWLEVGNPVTLSSGGWAPGDTREGRVLSILPSLEENGLQAQLLVEVDDPLALDRAGPALRLGDVLRAEFTTTPQENLVALPASALRPGEQVWWLDEDDRLRRDSVTLAYRGEEEVLVRQGLDAGVRVVIGGLAQPSIGQQVRPRQIDTRSTQEAGP
ncbi:efflux RND transporter periplasmic adaptor subunit [Halomonas sp. Bachu 37]|uniref:efflux RND transporter periplasmic adaptor subunit n=1 Tax=Halomonas kashgarensis TaxID=3084920 RepID=UPI003217E911